MTAVERDTVSLSAGVAQTVTLSTPFTLVEVVVVSITGADSVVIWGDTRGSTAVAEADELDAVIGTKGAYNQFTAKAGTTSISLIADTACKVLVSRKQ